MTLTHKTAEILNDLHKQAEAAKAEEAAAKERGDITAQLEAAEKETALEARIRQIVEGQVSSFK